MSEDFLSRWSRRKRATRRTPEEKPPPAPPPDEAAEPAADPAPPGEPSLCEEEIAALPPVEDLTAESDFGAFLRKGVPERLRNAALRRMWALDPAIRDHVGDARDYAWDWNVPGGVPGGGPLLPCDRVEDTLQRLFGDDDGRTPAPEGAPNERAGAGVAGREEVLPEGDARPVATHGGPESPSETQAHDGSLQEQNAGRMEEKSDETGSPDRPPRRHGGAKPV
jgi:Protein of unknown function (DUF3306)